MMMRVRAQHAKKFITRGVWVRILGMG